MDCVQFEKSYISYNVYYWKKFSRLPSGSRSHGLRNADVYDRDSVRTMNFRIDFKTRHGVLMFMTFASYSIVGNSPQIIFQYFLSITTLCFEDRNYKRGRWTGFFFFSNSQKSRTTTEIIACWFSYVYSP